MRSPRAHDLLLFSVTNLKSIAARILEEDGIVMRLFVSRSFDISRARLDYNRSQNENKVGIYCGRLGSSRDGKTAQYLVGVPFASRKYWPGGSVCTMSRNSFAS